MDSSLCGHVTNNQRAPHIDVLALASPRIMAQSYMCLESSPADLKGHSEAGIRELGLEREKIKECLVHLRF